MKNKLKNLAVIMMAVMILFVSGCTKNEENDNTTDQSSVTDEIDFSLADLVKSNRLSSILSIKNSAKLYSSSEYFESGTVYIEKGLEYGEYDDYCYMDLDGTLYYYIPDENGNRVLYEEWNALSPEEIEANQYKPDDMFCVDDETADEKLTKVIKNDDGTLDIYTESSPEYMLYYDLGYESAEEVLVDVHYKVDAETLLLLEGDDSFVIDGEEKLFSTSKIVYDDVISSLGAEMLEAVNESITAKEGKCITFTAIYDAGTDKEESFSITVGENHNVDLKLRDGYAIYLDKDQKQLSDTRWFIGGSEDVTVYLFPEQ